MHGKHPSTMQVATSIIVRLIMYLMLDWGLTPRSAARTALTMIATLASA
jgi:hypothetical protein